MLRVLIESYTEMEDYHLYHLGRCAADRGDRDTAAAAWSRLLATHPRSVHAPAAALAQGRMRRAAGDLGAAEPLLRRAAGGEAEVADAARLELAEIAVQRGEIRTAHAALSALREQAGGEVARKAREGVVALRRQYPELAPRSAAERQHEVDLLLREGAHAGALGIVGELLATATGADRPSLLVRRAEVELAAGDSERHLRTLREAHEQYPQSPHAPEALFREARWLWNKDRDADAKAAFIELERRYPRSRHIITARYAQGRIAQAAGDRQTAITRFTEVVQRHPGTALATDARWQLAWIRYYDRQWEAAGREFAHLAHGRTTAQAADATYWRARTRERAGDTAGARELYRTLLERAPDSYYAGLAAERLGRPPQANVGSVDPPRSLFPDLPADMRGDYHLTRARELHRARLMSQARREVRVYLREHPAPPRHLLIDLYRSVDAHREAIRLGGSGNVSYPFAFWDLVAPHAERNRIDPLLVLALMRQESMFDSEARSPADARGLMQLLPSTAGDVAARIGRGGRIDLYEPATNIELGVAHLRELADRYGGDRVRILAAYNAGGEAVDKWDRRFADRPLDEYVESITFRETRDYVKKVLSNYRSYQRRVMAAHGHARTDIRTDRERKGGLLQARLGRM